MKKHIILISLLITVVDNRIASATCYPSNENFHERWSDNVGIYFDANFYQNLAKEGTELTDGRLSGYIDTLMTWGMTKSSPPLQFFGGSYAMSSDYIVSIIAVKHRFADYLQPSHSIWAVVTNAEGHVVNSECLYNLGENRVYRDNICSILVDNGRMVIQQTFENKTCTVRYLNWKDLYEDGMPSSYFQCHDELWSQGSVDLTNGAKKISLLLEDYIDDSGIINLIKTDYLRTDKTCKKIELGQIQADENYLIQSTKTRTSRDYTIVLRKTQNEEDYGFYFSILHCDIYNLNLNEIVVESNLINRKAIQNIKIIIKSDRSGEHLKIRNKRFLSLRPILKLELI